MSNLHHLIYALSDALDLVGIDDVNHGKRVAYMALECADRLNLRGKDKVDLLHASLLHDCGVSSTRIHDKLVFMLDWEGAEDHCIRGYQMLKRSEKLAHLSNVILYHHTHFDTLKKLQVDYATALMANLIFMVDRVDALHAQVLAKDPETSMVAVGATVRDELRELSGSFFDPKLVDTFLEVSDREGFWFTFHPEPLHRYLSHYIDSLKSEAVNMAQLHEVAELFAYFVDAKSHYTADHSYDVAKLSAFLAAEMGLPPDVCSKIEIAGLLHDIGKLRIPDELLDKEGSLSDDEFNIVKVHPYETDQILSSIPGLEDIATWASQHHEKLNGKGYPYHTASEALPLPSRIIAVADVFQALAQNRPYRKSLKPLEIMEIVKKKVDNNELDAHVVAVVEQHLQRCWELALANSSHAAP